MPHNRGYSRDETSLMSGNSREGYTAVLHIQQGGVPSSVTHTAGGPLFWSFLRGWGTSLLVFSQRLRDLQTGLGRGITRRRGLEASSDPQNSVKSGKRDLLVPLKQC